MTRRSRWWWAVAPALPALLACNTGAAPQQEEAPDRAAPAAVVPATYAARRAGPPSPDELRARLLARSIPPADADRLIAALLRLSDARAALRRGAMTREEADAAHDALERLCPEITGMSCDALLFQPRRSP